MRKRFLNIVFLNVHLLKEYFKMLSNLYANEFLFESHCKQISSPQVIKH